MLKNHLKIIFRNIMRHKGYSFINISGLAVGMACTILIFLWVQHELSYDRFHKNAQQTYRVNLESHRHDGVHHHPWIPFPLAETLKDQFPEILAEIHCYHRSNGQKVFWRAQKALLLVDLDKKGPDKIIQTFPTHQEISHMVAVTADNRMAFVANIRSGSVSVIDLSLDKGNPMKIIPCGKGTEGLDVSPDGKEVWAVGCAHN